MTEVQTAQEGRAIVKRIASSVGLDEKFTVRYENNPFGGKGIFWVGITTPKGVTVATASSSATGSTMTYSTDRGAHASKINLLREKLKEETTNLRVA